MVILPGQFKRQPRYAARIALAGLGQGLRAFWMPQGEGSALVRNHVTGKRAVSFSGVTQGIAEHGHVLNFAIGQVDTGDVIDIAGSEITIALRLRLPASSTRRLFGNHENSSTGYLLYQNGFTVGCRLNNTLIAPSPVLVAGSWSQVAFSCFGGNKLVVLDGSVTSTSGGVVVSGTGTTVKLGAYNWPGHPDFNGDLEYVALWERGLSAPELLAFQENPYRIFASTRSRVASSAPSHALAASNLSTASSSSTGAITQAHTLAGQPSTQSNAADAIAITVSGIHDLVGTAADQTNSAGSGTVAQIHMIVPALFAQDASVASAAVAQIHVLAADEIRQGNLGNTTAVTRDHDDLAPVSLVQHNAGQTAVVRQAHILAAAFSLQRNRAGTGSTGDGVIVEPTLTTGTRAGIPIRKPGIPAGTPEWLKTMIEILVGRRGNRIAPPLYRTLDFSASPTKAECEALYSYTNEVREVVEKIVTRLDS